MSPADGSNDIERQKDGDVIPVPPDATPAAPVEEPPGSKGRFLSATSTIARTHSLIGGLDKFFYCNYPCYSYGG